MKDGVLAKLRPRVGTRYDDTIPDESMARYNLYVSRNLTGLGSYFVELKLRRRKVLGLSKPIRRYLRLMNGDVGHTLVFLCSI